MVNHRLVIPGERMKNERIARSSAVGAGDLALLEARMPVNPSLRDLVFPSISWHADRRVGARFSLGSGRRSAKPICPRPNALFFTIFGVLSSRFSRTSSMSMPWIGPWRTRGRASLRPITIPPVWRLALERLRDGPIFFLMKPRLSKRRATRAARPCLIIREMRGRLASRVRQRLRRVRCRRPAAFPADPTKTRRVHMKKLAPWPAPGESPVHGPLSVDHVDEYISRVFRPPDPAAKAIELGLERIRQKRDRYRLKRAVEQLARDRKELEGLAEQLKRLREPKPQPRPRGRRSERRGNKELLRELRDKHGGDCRGEFCAARTQSRQGLKKVSFDMRQGSTTSPIKT